MEVIKIDPDAKQIIILEFPEHVNTLDVRKQVEELKNKLWEWWESYEPFAVIGLQSGFKVRVERVDSIND